MAKDPAKGPADAPTDGPTEASANGSSVGNIDGSVEGNINGNANGSTDGSTDGGTNSNANGNTDNMVAWTEMPAAPRSKWGTQRAPQRKDKEEAHGQEDARGNAGSNSGPRTDQDWSSTMHTPQTEPSN